MTDTIIFQFLGISYFAIGLGAMLNPMYYRKLLANFLETPSVIYLGGFLSLLLGYFIANYDFVRTTDLVWVIKLFGTLALLKGLVILVLPRHYIELTKTFSKNVSLMMFELSFVLLLGLAMIYIGFYA